MKTKSYKSFLKPFLPFLLILFGTFLLNACGDGSVDSTLVAGSGLPSLAEASESELVDTVASSSTPEFTGKVYADGIVDLTWPSDEEITEYRIYRNGRQISTVTEAGYIDTTVQDDIALDMLDVQGNLDETVSTSYLYRLDGYSDNGVNRTFRSYLRFRIKHRRHASSRNWQTVDVTPESTDEESTDPELIDPEPTDPESTDPESTNPESTNPESTNPELTNPEQSASGEIIFETDFSQDTGYFVTNSGLWNGNGRDAIAPPTGWDGIKAGGESAVAVITGAGVDASNALRMKWNPSGNQPVVSLGKHLTGNTNTGYEEVYIRYHVRLPNKFKVANDGEGINHWKWGRLYQNTSPDNTDREGELNKWTENRANVGFVLWTFNGNIPNTDINVSWAENTGEKLGNGSRSGEQQKIDYYISGSDPHTAPGYFESLWDINTTDRPGELENNTNQGWHTIEFRFKLATTATSDDGIFEMWFDGINQGQYSRIRGAYGAPTASGIPTTNKGSGFNFFVFFDNMQGWNAQWSRPEVDGFVYVNDVVISTSRIGHAYQVQ